jgi:hypothetical protein
VTCHFKKIKVKVKNGFACKKVNTGFTTKGEMNDFLYYYKFIKILFIIYIFSSFININSVIKITM